MRRSLMAFGVAALLATGVQAGSVTWKGGNGDWNHATNWSSESVPSLGDQVTLNSGTANYWGVQTGQLGADIKNDSSVTLNGATVQFQNRFGFSVGFRGTETASFLTINAGAYNANASQLIIGNTPTAENPWTEAGTVTVAAGATLDGTSTELIVEQTGTFNSAGAVTDFSITVVRGFINITGGSLDITRLDLVREGSRFTIADGVVTATVINTEYIGYGGRWVNFAPDSTGTLRLSQVDVDTLTSYVNNGYIRLDGVKDPSKFVVSAFGDGGSQVSVVPEPASAALLGLGVLGMGRRRRGSVA